MKIAEFISVLESLAPPSLQEHYDNAGLLTGNAEHECTGVLCCLDATDETIKEAIARSINTVAAPA